VVFSGVRTTGKEAASRLPAGPSGRRSVSVPWDSGASLKAREGPPTQSKASPETQRW
jgi:hypothetical protein